jgi:hypothetical protein
MEVLNTGCSIPILESEVGFCVYPYNHANARYNVDKKVSTRFELASKIWDRICELQNGLGRNLDDSFNSYTTRV